MRPYAKKIIRMLLLLLVFAAVVPFVYPLKNGKPLLSFEQLRLPSLPKVSLPINTEGTESGSVTAYKWQDKQGIWHFGNEPPQGVAFEAIELDPNANLIQGLNRTPQPANEAQSNRQGQSDEGDIPFGYTPEKIGEAMEKARLARDALQKHQQDLEGIDK